ncbi:MAG: hypothetical protein ABSA18_17430 [Dehalococcoidia bacterium]|jgi:ppGpp synthetase/RelA/SpoT-type nucleotidyltranferase
MKIPGSIREKYDDQLPLYEQLRDRVDNLIKNKKDSRWHYESRVKNPESFALKIETGRYLNPDQIEDTFACTLVVENLESVSKAEQFIIREFNVAYRRPVQDSITSKSSDSFVFDDLRIYCKWRDEIAQSPSGLTDSIFEVQIKTYLQHAWSIATHDLIYKSDEKNWSKERIAFQIKAMLEHADASILEVDRLSQSPCMNKTNKITEQISKIIEFIHLLWPSNMLPQDVKRLAENVNNLIMNIGIDLDELKRIIELETSLKRGINILNLSPYETIVQSLLYQVPEKIESFIYIENRKFKIYLCRELDIPFTINPLRLRNAIWQAPK